MSNLWFNIRVYKWFFQWGPEQKPAFISNDYWDGKYWPPFGIYAFFGHHF